MMSAEFWQNLHYLLSSDAEGQGSERTGKRSEKKRPKRRKKQERHMPKLTIIHMANGGDVVECHLDTAKYSSVTFKFNCDDDQPGDIASNLVSIANERIFYLGFQISIWVVVSIWILLWVTCIQFQPYDYKICRICQMYLND